MTSRYATSSETEIIELDDAEANAAVFDRVCHRELDISGEEFLRRWDAGTYAGVDVDSVDGLAEVVAALGFAR